MDSHADDSGDQREAQRRPYVGINFTCCNVYSRVYRNRAGDAYEGMCPKCYRRVKLGIGPGGTSQRFFDAG
jgi:hypothetical protein